MNRLLAALLLLIAAPAALAAPGGRDWSATVTRAPSGAHVQGNPAAPSRLVEYVSYTCPHCAHFVAEGTGPLKAGWVRSGRLSVEIRNLVRDRYDLTAALLARCGGPARFMGNHEAIFAAQQGWLEKVIAYDRAPGALAEDAAPAVRMADIAQKTGLFALMARRGVAPKQARACLADKAAMDAVLAMTGQSRQDGVSGTPSFLLDGKLLEAHDWAALRAQLPAPRN